LASSVLWPSPSTCSHDGSWLLEAGKWVAKDASGETARRTKLACPGHVAIADPSAPERKELRLSWIRMGHSMGPGEVMGLEAIRVQCLLVGMIEIAPYYGSTPGFARCLPGVDEAASSFVTLGARRIRASTSGVPKSMTAGMAPIAWTSRQTERTTRNEPINAPSSKIRASATPRADGVGMVGLCAQSLEPTLHLKLSRSVEQVCLICVLDKPL